MADVFAELEKKSESAQIYASIKREIHEMAYYTARCWQPVFAAHTWSKEDIQALAEDGVRRLMTCRGISRVAGNSCVAGAERMPLVKGLSAALQMERHRE